jgi:hypothetical protein
LSFSGTTYRGENTMDNKWAEDAYRSFEQGHGEEEAVFENMANILVHLEYWCETKRLKFGEVQQRARALKQMFDGADNLVKEGFDPSQISLILQGHFDCQYPADPPEGHISIPAFTFPDEDTPTATQ